MSQEPFAPTSWVEGLSRCLQEIVDYERSLEESLIQLRWQAEYALGIRTDAHDDVDARVRDRISDEYGASFASTPPWDSEYRRSVSGRLNKLLEVLLEHPSLKAAVYQAEGEQTALGLRLGLNLGVSQSPGHQVIFLLMGLIDYAVEHSPTATADALAQIIQRGEDKDLSCYWILCFRGLCPENRHEFQNGLSIIPFEDVRRYMPDDRVRVMLEASDSDINREPIGAVIYEAKWGPLFVPAGYDMAGMDWPESPGTFGENARLLLDVLAVVHRQPVRSPRALTTVVEHQIEHLVGHRPRFSQVFRDIIGVNTTRIDPVATPTVSDGKLEECERLFLRCKHDVQLRLALSRLASSLSRTGELGAFDKVLDVAISLEVMYQLDASRGRGSQLSRRARNFIGRDREDLNWIRRTAESIYAARNGVIHDGTLPQDADQISDDAFELGRRTLLHLAVSGCPTS